MPPSSAKLLSEIWNRGQQPGLYYCMSTKSQGGKWRDHYFKTPADPKVIRRFIKEYSDHNLYFCPTLLTDKRRRKEYVADSAVLWADLDESRPGNCPIRPQIAWLSSPDRYAGLWFLDASERPDRLEELNKTLSAACHADMGGWDLTQVLRIPGTRNYKYRGGPKGKLLWYDQNELASTEFKHLTNGHREDADDVFKRVKAKLPIRVKKLLTATSNKEGKRSDVLWFLERSLFESKVSEEDCFTLLKNCIWNKFEDRRNGDAQLRNEISKAYVTDSKPNTKPRANSTRVDSDSQELNVHQLSGVTPEKIDWLWYPYIPRGKVTLLEGDPGLGKSWATMAIAAAVSRGRKLPGQKVARNGKVLVLSAEDGIADTIRPRVGSLEANLRKVFAIDEPVIMDEEGIERVGQQIRVIKPQLVVLDPLVAYMGGKIDLHKANETRTIMSGLAHLAQTHHVAILAVRHLTKGQRDKSVYRGIGSIDIIGAARSAILVGQHPFDERDRVMVHIKSNLAHSGKSIRYRLRPESSRPFRWIGLCDITAPELLHETVPTKSKTQDGDDENSSKSSKS